MCVNQEFFTLYSTELLFDEPLSKHTNYKLGGKAKIFASPKTLKDLSELIYIAKTDGIKYYILGNGSNVLASDYGFDGIVICTRYLNNIIIEDNKVRCTSGVKLHTLLLALRDNGLTGLENLAGIPASVGGATFMNAGANEVQISDNIDFVYTLSDGRLKKYDKSQCGFLYRESIFQRSDEVILSVDFSFDKSDYDTCRKTLNEYLKKRSKYPKSCNCGCIFKNPEGGYAGELIEKAGLKGYTIGGATISTKHANFITTNKNAKACDVYNLINYVKIKIKEKFNVNLTKEVKFLGEF